VHLRPGDPLSHPLRGERRPASGLVLRVSPGGACEAVLRIDAVCRFNGLADAQYLSAAPLKRPRLAADDPFGAAPDAVEDTEEETPLLVVPPRMFHTDAPLEYGFRSAFRQGGQAVAAGAAAAATQPEAGGHPRAGAKASALPTSEIDFRASEVPQPLASDSGFAPPPQVEEVLGPLFRERRVWSNAALTQRLPAGSAGSRLRKYIPCYAYRFVNGPWHRQWVARGLDPRVDPTTGPFQCLDYRLPKEWYPRQPSRRAAAVAAAAVAAAPSSQGGAQDAHCVATPSADRGRFDVVHTLKALPARRTTFFALFDLRHPLIQQLVQQPAQRAVCDEHNGWYVKTTLDAVKAVLRDSFEACALAEGFSSIPQKVRAQAKRSKAARVQAALAAARQRMEVQPADGGGHAPRHGGAHGRGDLALVDDGDEDDDEEDAEEDDEEAADEETGSDDDGAGVGTGAALRGPAHTGAAFAAALGQGPGTVLPAGEDEDMYDVFDE